LWIILISGILEGTLILGQYYPGGLVIFLGVISAGRDIPRVIAVISMVSLAFVIGYTFDYLIGKYGWYRLFVKFGLKKSLDAAQQKLQKHEFSAIIFSYWEPNLASITATAAGILQLPLKRFSLRSLAGIIFWNIVWGTLVSSLGVNALKLMGLKWVFIIFVVWATILLIKHFLFYKKKPLNIQ
jgi:membrane protein DedA with SNARE-associated domain